MAYLTAPDAISAKQSYRYYVDLVSVQRDYQGVPEFTRTIDVVVTQPSKEAIVSLVAACSWLKGYEVISYNELSFQEAPF
ncbi:MAG: hypothetical protein CLLPBCKN_006601 [Chroococcidiopsis cubana SAG 39.79]|uniref:Uncharacterized protein n=2 Tax=Chroococcidiopsis TaxID=54298 RepID=A0AB37UBF7_9CYAN|nr:hypothetical protein [Chroococcidiopsis cubana]MDZ4876784.1 hypothetical protein [Chroococcidiopsis cubana SAG 39.79]MDZ4877166.1 hypothetical protein [Chroococcidiopsis cubana SAG 39.79]PSB60367.1 hypothetical protein C7B79_25965 [Chroococcidiopsis cubana CCALA 043]RUT03671.1 hypothetical protein DSM107010_60070 [Chroococcidiopsis cubana SAG 39.79]